MTIRELVEKLKKIELQNPNTQVCFEYYDQYENRYFEPIKSLELLNVSFNDTELAYEENEIGSNIIYLVTG